MKKYPHTFSGREASQSKFELESFIQFLREKKIKRYLEIGAREGDTFHEIVTHVETIEYALAVDLPGGLWGKETTKNKLSVAIKDLQQKGYNAEYLFGNSQDEKIVSNITSMGEFDAILIDGDHTLDGVTKDWNNYCGISKIVAFHDIVGHDQFEKVKQNLVEVPILWNELKEKYDHLEFIDKDSKMGIGVILQ